MSSGTRIQGFLLQVLEDDSNSTQFLPVDTSNSSDAYAPAAILTFNNADVIPQCRLAEVQTETADRIAFNRACRFIRWITLNFALGTRGIKRSWRVSRVDAASTTLSLPKTIFMNSTLRYAVEIFYRFDDLMQTSGLTPSRH